MLVPQVPIDQFKVTLLTDPAITWGTFPGDLLKKWLAGLLRPQLCYQRKTGNECRPGEPCKDNGICGWRRVWEGDSLATTLKGGYKVVPISLFVLPDADGKFPEKGIINLSVQTIGRGIQLSNLLTESLLTVPPGSKVGGSEYSHLLNPVVSLRWFEKGSDSAGKINLWQVFRQLSHWSETGQTLHISFFSGVDFSISYPFSPEMFTEIFLKKLHQRYLGYQTWEEKPAALNVVDGNWLLPEIRQFSMTPVTAVHQNKTLGKSHDLTGFSGEIEFRIPPRWSWLPLLWYGQWLQVGGQTTLGFGAYRLKGLPDGVPIP